MPYPKYTPPKPKKLTYHVDLSWQKDIVKGPSQQLSKKNLDYLNRVYAVFVEKK